MKLYLKQAPLKDRVPLLRRQSGLLSQDQCVMAFGLKVGIQYGDVGNATSELEAWCAACVRILVELHFWLPLRGVSVDAPFLMRYFLRCNKNYSSMSVRIELHIKNYMCDLTWTCECGYEMTGHASTPQKLHTSHTAIVLHTVTLTLLESVCRRLSWRVAQAPRSMMDQMGSPDPKPALRWPSERKPCS